MFWDKSASIDFLRPGRGRVKARFDLPRAKVDELRAGVESKGKINPTFEVTVVGRHKRRYQTQAWSEEPRSDPPAPLRPPDSSGI